MTKDQFKFFYKLRVRYAEVDSQGIVFNAHYLTYFDTALTEYMRGIDYDYKALVSNEKLDFHVVKSTIEYLGTVAFDDVIEIGVAPGRIGNSSITWNLAVFKQGCDKCLTKGEIIWVCARVGEHKSQQLPESLICAIREYQQ